MLVRKAAEQDIYAIIAIYEYARKFMIKSGNPTQWAPDYPNVSIIKKDMEAGNCYVCTEEDKIAGTFAFIIGEEPTYKRIERGDWHFDMPYGTIHRLAGNGQVRGVAKACFDFCKKKADYVRVDTHANNRPMRSAILKNGFSECGIIHVADGSERIAFDFQSINGTF